MQVEILYEDNHLIVINKPAGILTQSDYTKKTSAHEEVKKYLKEKYQKKGNVFLGIVHRLDRDVSGVLVFARTSKAASRLFQQFKERRVIKLYCAIVEWRKSNDLEKNLWIPLRTPMRRVKDITISSNLNNADFLAEMQLKLLHKEGSLALVLIHLITGKKHQIRAQLASVGLPILGDVKYGSSTVLQNGAICLHSVFLQFDHPTKKTAISFTAPLPQIFQIYYPQVASIFNISNLSGEIVNLDGNL